MSTRKSTRKRKSSQRFGPSVSAPNAASNNPDMVSGIAPSTINSAGLMSNSVQHGGQEPTAAATTASQASASQPLPIRINPTASGASTLGTVDNTISAPHISMGTDCYNIQGQQNTITTKANDELALHVSSTIKQKIFKGEFVEFSSLLQNNNVQVKASNDRQTISIVQGELVVQPKHQQKVANIEQWTDAFLIFMNIYCQVHIDKVHALLKYANNVRIAAKRCGHLNFGWRQYDEQFRLKMAQNQNILWGDIDLELWLLFVNQTSSSQVSNSNRVMFKCYAFNYSGVCNRINCTYSHSCIKCFGAHPMVSCQRGHLGNNATSFQNIRPRLQMRPQGQSHYFRSQYRQRAPGAVVSQRPFPR